MKRFSALFFAFCFLLTVPAYAAEPYVPWSDTLGYNIDYNIYAIGPYFTVYDTTSDMTMTYEEPGHIDRTIGDRSYSVDTLVFKSDSSTTGFSGSNFVFKFTDLFNQFYNSFVSDFDIVFLINIYGSVNSSFPSLDVPPLIGRAFLSDILYSDDAASTPFDLILDVELVDSTRYSQASSTYVFRVSYHGDTFYYDTRSFGETSITFDFSVPDFTRTEIYSSIIDIDVGVVASRVGRSIVAIPWEEYDKPLDIWAGIGTLPPVQFPSFDDSSVSTTVSDLFESVSSLDIVSVLIIPIGVIAIGFFTFRMLLWK